MKKIFVLLTLMFLLVGCIESVAVIGTGATNGKIVQSSMQTGLSYGIKKTTGKTPLQHTLNFVKKNKTIDKKIPCSSFVDKKDLETCLKVKKRIISKQAETKEKKYSNKSSKEFVSSLQFSINEKSKIKYLD